MTRSRRRRGLTHVGVAALIVGLGIIQASGSGPRAGTESLRAAGKEEVRVFIRGAGEGSVLSIPSGIDCPGSCSGEFFRGSEVVLVAGSPVSSRFAGWKGACAGVSPLCVLVADRESRVTTTFAPGPHEDVSFQTRPWLRVTSSGRGRVTSSPPGINCPNQCQKSFKKGTPVTLQAASERGMTAKLSSLVASCAVNSCRVRMETTVSVNATFQTR
jgi:hypothetical protein